MIEFNSKMGIKRIFQNLVETSPLDISLGPVLASLYGLAARVLQKRISKYVLTALAQQGGQGGHWPPLEFPEICNFTLFCQKQAQISPFSPNF